MLFFISLILLGQFIRVNMDTFCCNYRILEVVGQEIIQFTSQHQGNLTQSEFTVLCLAKIKNNSSYNTWFCILSATPNFLLLTVTRLQISLCHCHHHRHFTVIKLTQWEMPSTFFFFFKSWKTVFFFRMVRGISHLFSKSLLELYLSFGCF